MDLSKGGLRKGDKVSVLMLNSIEMLEIMMGTVKAGGVIVPLSVTVTGESLAAMINDSDSRFLFAAEPFSKVISSIKPSLTNISGEAFFVTREQNKGWVCYQSWRESHPEDEPRVRLKADDDLNIIYSSGTTESRKASPIRTTLGSRPRTYSPSNSDLIPTRLPSSRLRSLPTAPGS